MNPIWLRFLPGPIRAKIEGRGYLQNVMTNTGWLFVDNIIKMTVGLFVGVWVARYLGPNQYGNLSYALAFVALFSTFANLGLNTIVVRDLVRAQSQKDEILGTTFLLKLVGGILAFGLALATITFLRPADRLTRMLVGIIAAGMVFQAGDTIDYWYQSQVQAKFTVWAKNSAFLIISGVKIALILLHASLIAFAWAGLAEIVLGSLGLVLTYTIGKQQIRAWHMSLHMTGKLLRDSWPLIFSGIVSMIYLRIDQVMLGQMASDAEVGIYSAAVRLAEVWYFIPMITVSSVYPSIVEARGKSETLFYDRLQLLYNAMAASGYLIALPVTFLSGWIVHVVFGPAYGRAGDMLAVLIWAGIFVNLGVARSSFLTTMNWTKVHFMTVFFGSIINVVLNILLIPRWGGMGAVIASCAAYWFAAHGACFLYKPMHRTGFMLTKALIFPKVW